MQQVTLNKNSWHFKLYKSMVSDDTPKSLCPYFWIMVLLIILSPLIGVAYGIVEIGTFLTKKFGSKKIETFGEKLERYRKEEVKSIRRMIFWDRAGEICSWVTRYIVLPSMIICIIGLVIDGGMKIGWLELLKQTLMTLTVVGVLIGLVFLLIKISPFLGKILSLINPLNWKVIIIIGEMIKTVYTKACPLVTWVEDKPKNNDL
jgi:hypothetical protein